MRKRSSKIGKIVSIASAEERRSGVATGRSRQQLEEQKARLGELHAYRHDYAALAKSMTNVTSAQWQDYQTFMHRLDQAVRSQQEIVKDSEQQLELHRRRWLEKRKRLESLQRVLESYRDSEELQEDRRQQRELDDLPLREDLYSDETES